jgi:ribosomal RNA-processing protein 7
VNTRFAHVAFESADAIDAAINLDELQAPEELIEQCQHQPWLTAWRAGRPVDTTMLEGEVTKSMAAFEEKERDIREQRKRMKDEVDDDGFTMVVNSRKKQAISSSESSRKKRRKKKETEMGNFYRFQIRESKREQLADLRSKFELDKKRIADMKETRKFRPFA